MKDFDDLLDDFIKSNNPIRHENDLLFYGRKYKLYRDGKFIGIAVWIKDRNIGDSFQTRVGKNVTVYNADTWELINKK